MLKQRIVTALVLAVVFVGTVLFGEARWVNALFALVLWAATRELLALTLRASLTPALIGGALYALLQPFAARGISMTRIESRPARSGLWEYVFFVDIEGHAQDPNVAEALAEIEGAASLFKVLGSYPRADG